MINRREASYGTCKNQKTDGDAEAAAREGWDEAAGEWRCRKGRSTSVCAGRAQTSAKSILDENRKAVVES